jgi:hypothetical protein
VSLVDPGETLAAALRVPDRARLAAAFMPGPLADRLLAQQDAGLGHRTDARRFLRRRVHRVELMVAHEVLVQRTRVLVFLEDDEMMQQIEAPLPLEHPVHQQFQLQRCLRRVALTINRTPDLEPLLVRRHGTHARLQAMVHHQRRVVMQQRGNLRLVGLKLREGAPQHGVLVRCAL